MTREPGADELRMKAILKDRGVGPDAVPPKPAERPRDWLDDILDSPPPSAPASEPEQKPADKPAPAATQPAPKKTKARKKRKKRRPGPDTARTAWDTQPRSPRQSLIEAWDGVPYRLKWLIYHASAAYLGWSMGLVDYATYVTAWIVDTGLTGAQAFFWYVAAALTFLLYRRTRRMLLPVAWLAAVPVTSTVTGVLLYGTPTP